MPDQKHNPEFPSRYNNPDHYGDSPPQVDSGGWQLNPPQRPKTKKKKWPWVLGGIVVVLLLCSGVISAIANSDSGKQGLKAGNGAKPVATSPVSNIPDVPKAPAHVPTAKDIVLKIKVTKKQCFGTAGCLVDFRIDTLTYNGEAMDKGKTYEVIYEVKGLKDPYTNTLTLNGDGTFEYEKEENGQTSTTTVSLKANVTSVDVT